jgi:N-acyl-L-homoserine lactone synthetase
VKSRSGDRPRWLASADELAGQLIDRASPIEVRIATSADEIQAVFQLRHEIVIEMGWRDEEDLAAGGRERDEYDASALQLAAWDGDVLAGTLRVVLPEEGRLLPIEEAYDLVVEPEGLVVEIGRVIVAHPYRGGDHRVLGALSGSAWMQMRAGGFEWVSAAATAEIVELFRRLGFEVDVLGEPRNYWGEERYPIRMGAPDPTEWT